MLDWRIGTMGFGYREWAGAFYPPGLRTGGHLPYYAGHFDAVELDTTFYATPPADRVRRWAEAVPDGFRFTVKTPWAVTHEPPGCDPLTMRRFLNAVRGLGDQLGPVLLQFSPTFDAGQRGRLAALLATLPTDLRYAVEFRHASWWRHAGKAAADMLREHRCAWVAADDLRDPLRSPGSDDPRLAPRPMHITTDFLYVRWVGVHGRFPEMNRERFDPTPRLARWKDWIDAHLERSPGVHTVWGLFNNDYAGYSVATARRFMRLAGVWVPPLRFDPKADHVGQAMLFE